MRIDEISAVAPAFAAQKVVTPDYGTVSLAPNLFNRWNADGKALVGWPVSDSFSFQGGIAVYCESGMLIDPPTGDVLAVHGRIYVKYRDLGDVHGWVGLPTSEEVACPGNGRVSHFQHADIYWRADSDAHEVHGAIRNQFNAQGGTGGFLGFPLTDESPVMNGHSEIGRFNRFQGGVVYWSGGTGAFEVHGAIRDQWENKMKGALGDLGLPLSNELRTPSDSYRYSNFERGVIVFRTSDGAIFTFTQIEVYVSRYDSKGDDGFLRGSQDIYVKVALDSSTGENFHARMPSDGDYGADENIERVLLNIPRLQGETNLHIKFEGWDSDWPDGDDHLGTVEGDYNIENLWGIFEDATHWNSDFMVSFKVRQIVNFDPSRFRENMYWHFHNFSTPKLSWQQYAATFSDVDNDESVVWHPFDHIYYQVVYKGVASSGNCFGMCWESIFAQVGRSIYREPISLVPPTNGTRPDVNANGEVINEINIKHGYQVSAQMIDWFLGKFILGQTHDPVRAFKESRSQFAQGDYPVFALTSKSLSVAGHVVRPYAWDDSRMPWRVYIADPNQPLTAADDDFSTFIEIDPNQNTFSYQHGANDVWTGGTWSGGRMYSVPFHVICHQPRTPFWEVLALLVGGGLILLGGDAQTTQIRDSAGNTFYQLGLTEPPTLHEHIRRDQGRIPNMARIHMTDDIGAFSHFVHDASRFVRLDRAPEMYYMTRGSHIRNLGDRLHDVLAVGDRIATATATPEPTTPTPTPPTHIGRSRMGDLAARDLRTEVTATRLDVIPDLTTPATPIPAGSFEHSIQQGNGSYTWGIRTPLGGTIIDVPAVSGTQDKVLVENIGHVTQALTLQPQTEKSVAIHVGGRTDLPGQERSFTVRDLGLKAGQTVRTHLDATTGGLVLENPGDATQMTVEIRAGGATSPVATRTAVPIEAASIVRIEPVSWAPTEMATTKLRVEKLTAIGGTAISSQEI